MHVHSCTCMLNKKMTYIWHVHVCTCIYMHVQCVPKKCIILFKMLLLGLPNFKINSAFFPGSVCVLSTCTNLNNARRVHTVHTDIYCAHCVFQMCPAEIFFLTMCTDHRSTTRHLILDLFFPRGPWGWPLSAHGGPMHVMCTLCTLSVIQCTKRARTISQQQNITDTFCFLLMVTEDVKLLCYDIVCTDNTYIVHT